MQKTLIVIPCYNEESRINLSEFNAYLQQNYWVDFLFVNDGSTDNTSEKISLFFKNENRVNLLNLEKNKGKANAVRQGMLLGANKDYEFIGFWDADLSTPLIEIENFIKIFNQNPDLLMVLGSRIKRLGSKITRNTKRHYLGRIFSTLGSILTGIEVYDSQCGAKIFRKQIINNLFTEAFVTRWIFDLEILVRLLKIKGQSEFYNCTYELPLNQWYEVGGSKLKLKHMMQVPLNLIKIRKHYF